VVAAASKSSPVIRGQLSFCRSNRSSSDEINLCSLGTSVDPTTNCIGCQIKTGRVYIPIISLFPNIARINGIPNAIVFWVHPNKPITRNFGSFLKSSFNKYQAMALHNAMQRKINKIKIATEPNPILSASLLNCRQNTVLQGPTNNRKSRVSQICQIFSCFTAKIRTQIQLLTTR
jgi:hypothetical protein